MTSRKLARLPLIGTGIVPPSVGAPAGSFRSTRKTVSDTGRMRADSVRPDPADGRAVKLSRRPVSREHSDLCGIFLDMETVSCLLHLERRAPSAGGSGRDRSWPA